ncbi:MAG: hypothetical protein ABI120_02855 [Gemmatimonadaceae bacterium]
MIPMAQPVFRTSVANKVRCAAPRSATGAALLACLSLTLPAQGALKLGTEIIVAPAFETWSFAKPVPLDSLTIKAATQISLPFSVQLPLHARWKASITGAVASSSLDAEGANGKVTRSFTGLSDIRVRANGRLRGEGLQLTLGLNLPTGAVSLSPEQNDVLRVVAAPALNAQVPIAGTGFGGTVGLILARQISGWAWALGAGVEKRGSYAPLDAQIAGLDSRTELVPGGAAHISLGSDGLLGPHRLSVGLVADLFGTDQVQIVSNDKTVRTDDYQLGPTVSGALQLLVDNSRIRNFTLRLNERFRSGFTNGSGQQVEGSSGNYLELGASGLLGTPGRPSFLFGADVRQQSGLPVDKGLIGASLTAIGITAGLSVPTSTLEWRPALRFSGGSIKTSRINTGITSVSVGMTVIAR